MTKEWLTDAYTTMGLSIRTIAREAGCSHQNIYQYLLKFRIPRRSRNQRRQVKLPVIKPTPSERFWNRVQIGTPDVCWPWLGGCSGRGYGAIVWRHSHTYAHRVAWILTNGDIPDGLHICHHCDNPICCNPNHLFVGTASDNAMDREAKGRGGRHWTKLTWEQVQEIRELWATGGISQTRIAMRYGVSLAHVNKIVLYKARTVCRSY